MFLDFEAVARVVGPEAQPARLAAAEAEAKRRYQQRLSEGASHEDGWRLYMRTLLETAGMRADAALVDALRAEHDRFNLWRRVPPDLMSALDRASGAGLRLGVVSNSEGALEALFERVGLSGRFEVVVDSAVVGVRKPDPQIFAIALARMDLLAERTLYAGDIPEVDVVGARQAGLHAALIDPQNHFPDHTPRFPSVAALVTWLVG